jgi:glycosyltransferase involved in cell wall biosynthesis
MPPDRKSVELVDLIGIPGEEAISSWEDISRLVDRIQRTQHAPLPASKTDFLHLASQGTAFLTFDFGIDGVSIETAKYGRTLEAIYRPFDDPKLHFIAGDFYTQAERIIQDRWSRFRIDGINGWQKWDEGQWFEALYLEEMLAGSQRSSELAAEIYRQAMRISQVLGAYLIANEIVLLIPVNVASNPGNLALALALVLVTETLGTIVINSNHDFYWDGGKPADERMPDEEPGSRDHFFRNAGNRPFFSLFQRLYPWNGRRWLQVNINATQSENLVGLFGFSEGRVYEITTSVGDKLFEDYTDEDVKSARLRMAKILSGGQAQIHPFALDAHLEGLHEWMEEQSPRVIGARAGLTLDVTADGIIYLLQPTRVIARKRIEKGVELILALLQGPMKADFEHNNHRQLVLHVTGPTPLEHQADLETIFHAYGNLIDELPTGIAERVFLAFSAGHETHPSFDEYDFPDLNIVDIYRLATVILFPSEIEGRGLPIIESGAVGIPIICSRYRPTDVFANVIGEDLPKEERIRYFPFPENEFSEEFLDQVAGLLLHPEEFTKWRDHNRHAIRSRYSEAALRIAFQQLIERSFEIAP